MRGPYAILEWMRDNHGIEIPPPEGVGGNCQACKHLFENPAVEEVLDEALLAMRPEILGAYRLLESLGEPERLRLAVNRSNIRKTADTTAVQMA